MNELKQLIKELSAFRDARDWQQFHRLRHLIVSLSLESSELLEICQWRSDDELEVYVNGDAGHEALADECADVLAYLLLIAEHAEIDLAEAFRRKMEKNAHKYPLALAKGRADKYDRLALPEEKSDT